MIYDVVIIGGGIIGCATALEVLNRNPDARLLILEKEDAVGRHQTSHNSGVIHAGIYYAPGSVKAKLCREGLVATKEFCRTHGIPYEECGKLIVATNQTELKRIASLHERAKQNGLSLEKIDARQLVQIEPNISGLGALLSPETSIVDYQKICQKMSELILRRGGKLCFESQINFIEENEDYIRIGNSSETILAKKLIVCGGLQADTLAVMAGLKIDFQIIPFRGEYYQLPQGKSSLVQRLIYPAPDPDLPFLGIHITRMIDGSITLGPNAVLGFSREGYGRFSVSPADVIMFLGFSGFWRLLYKYHHHALNEFQTSLFKRLYLAQCQKYCPSLALEDLHPYRAGIRAQLVARDGTLVHDFVFKQTARMLHVCNAPSPAATSAIPIAQMILNQLG